MRWRLKLTLDHFTGPRQRELIELDGLYAKLDTDSRYDSRRSCQLNEKCNCWIYSNPDCFQWSTCQLEASSNVTDLVESMPVELKGVHSNVEGEANKTHILLT